MSIETELDNKELNWHKDEAYRWRICAISKDQSLKDANEALAHARRIIRIFTVACGVLSLWAVIRDWASLVELAKRIWP
ncbi:MAG: hypothetical protein KGL39_41265 [Patescibacteria group bacterium]|nr:hypothetical protein [Patescibacteria group bacterium]